MDIEQQIKWALETTEDLMRMSGNSGLADGLNQAQSIISQQAEEIKRLQNGIKDVLAKLQVKQDVNMDLRDYQTANAYETSIDLIEEVLNPHVNP